jgi:hypothetical protein
MSSFDMSYFYSRLSTKQMNTLKPELKVKRERPQLTNQSRRDFQIVMGLSAILLVTVLIGPVMSSYYDVADKIEECQHTKLSYQERGFYTSQEQFRNIITYCWNKLNLFFVPLTYLNKNGRFHICKYR